MSIYLDCNATTPTEPEVVEKIKQYLITDFGNEGCLLYTSDAADE